MAYSLDLPKQVVESTFVPGLYVLFRITNFASAHQTRELQLEQKQGGSNEC